MDKVAYENSCAWDQSLLFLTACSGLTVYVDLECMMHVDGFRC